MKETKPIKGFSSVSYGQNDVICRESDRFDHFFIVLQGKVRMQRAVKSLARKEADTLGAGDFFGVVAAMASRPHFDCAVAETDCILAVVNRNQYEQLIQSNHAIALKIAQQLSLRLQYLNTQFAKAVLGTAEVKTAAANHAPVNDETALYKLGDFYFNRKQYDQAYYAWRRYEQHFPKGAFISMVKMDLPKLAEKVKHPLPERTDDFTRKYAKGSTICLEGEEAEELFIIQKGRAKITKIIDNKEEILAEAQSGDIVGEMALLETKLRSANIIALENCEMKVLGKEQFESIAGTQPQIIFHLTAQLSDRIWYMNMRLKNRLIADLVTRCCDMLTLQLAKQNVNINIAPHAFSLTPGQLCQMSGIDGETESKAVITKMIHEKLIVIVDDKVVAKNKLELERYVKLYWTMHPIKPDKKR